METLTSAEFSKDEFRAFEIDVKSRHIDASRQQPLSRRCLFPDRLSRRVSIVYSAIRYSRIYRSYICELTLETGDTNIPTWSQVYEIEIDGKKREKRKAGYALLSRKGILCVHLRVYIIYVCHRSSIFRSKTKASRDHQRDCEKQEQKSRTGHIPSHAFFVRHRHANIPIKIDPDRCHFQLATRWLSWSDAMCVRSEICTRIYGNAN